MNKYFFGFLLAALLAACSTSSPSYRGSPTPTIPKDQAGVVGLLEVKISGIGEQMDAQARFIRPASSGVNAQAVTVISDVGINFVRRAVSFHDDDVALVRYVQAIFDITNTTGTAFNNLTLYGINVPGTTMSGTSITSMALADGTNVLPATVVQASPLVTGESLVRSMKPTHAMKVNGLGNGVEVYAPFSSLQVFTQAEASTVQTGAAGLTPPIVGDVLQYGFVAHNLLGGRSIGANGCSAPNCNKGSVGLAYKLPRLDPRKNNPFTFGLYFVVTNETTNIVSQSPEEQSNNGLAGSRAFLLGSSAEIRALAGSTLGDGNITRLCSVRTAGTNAAPLEFLVPVGTPCASPIQTDLSISGFYITQPTQNPQGNVPLVVGKTALARAFVTSNIAGVLLPTVRLSGWVNGVSQGTINLAGPGGVPVPASQAALTGSYNLTVPGTWIQPGLEVVLEVDPTNTVAELNENNNRFPATGRLPLEVHSVPVWDVTLVPITYANPAITPPAPTTPNVNVNAASGNNGYLDSSIKMFPVNAHTVQFHSAVTFTGNLNTGQGWNDLLDQVTNLRTTEGSSRHYIGVVNPQYGSGIAGIGWVGFIPASITWASLPGGSDVTAHEVGHNWNRQHSPCGTAGTQVDYPYAVADIGVFGYDAITNVLKGPNAFKDVMSYCGPVWISDFTYKAIMNYRTGGVSSLAMQAQAAPVAQRALLVTGRVQNGTVAIESVFPLKKVPVPTQSGGEYTLEGFSDSGALLFSVPIQLLRNHEVSYASFQTVVALEPGTKLGKLHIKDKAGSVKTQLESRRTNRPSPAIAKATRKGQQVEVSWDKQGANKVMVREVDGEVLGIDSTGVISVTTGSKRLEILYSDGLEERSEIVNF